MRAEYKTITEKFGSRCSAGLSAAVFTTYRAGGTVDLAVNPKDLTELAWLCSFCVEHRVPLLPLGAASNVLISDKGLKSVVVFISGMNEIKIENGRLVAGAGALWDDAVKSGIEQSLAGLEKTSGIPGTVGGAVFMNAGAFGQETFDTLESFEVMDRNGIVKILRASEVKHGYRKVDGLEGLIILSATFVLKPGDRKTLAAERECVLARRAEKQPLEYPSAGSVFKRPEGDFASRLIDAAGLKGTRIGNAQVSTKHAGFIVNLGGASASDIYALMQKVRAEVKTKTGVTLELEQILLGDFK